MMNLAPYKFRHALAEDGGPITRMEEGYEIIFDRRFYSALAFLRNDLSGPMNKSMSVAVPDGAGTGDDLQAARYRAIAEAIERWALHICLQDTGKRAQYGFNYDPSSNGIAAFPGLFNSPARDLAMTVAIERHCLIQWWAGNLGARYIASPIRGLRALRIDNPFTKHAVVLLFNFKNESYFIYGFGAAGSQKAAYWRAAIGLHRLGVIVSSHYEKRDWLSPEYIESHDALYERRSLFFSGPDGFKMVLQRIRQSENISASASKPLKILVDCEVVGPWSQYATVWRVVLEQPVMDFSSQRSDVFFW